MKSLVLLFFIDLLNRNPSSHSTVCFKAIKLLHSSSIRDTGVWLFTLSQFGESSLQAGKVRTQ